jgi:hypothetical protein
MSRRQTESFPLLQHPLMVVVLSWLIVSWKMFLRVSRKYHGRRESLRFGMNRAADPFPLDTFFFENGVFMDFTADAEFPRRECARISATVSGSLPFFTVPPFCGSFASAF